jgi:superfamily II DNA/RNA helicase
MQTLDSILDRVKQKFQISQFNPMQEEAFEVISKAKDTILLSATGSGKTLGFLIPAFSQLDDQTEKVQCLIIAPTRELAMQITEVAKNMALGLNIELCYGGHPIRYEKKALEQGPQVVIGTPGRVQDHIDRGNLILDQTYLLILDEFDKSLEMGFHKQMSAIIRGFKNKPQIILTSATDALEIPDFIRLANPERVDYLQDDISEKLKIQLVNSTSKDKLKTLYHLINDVGHESTFVFCNYRETVERVSDFLSEQGIHNDRLHGGMDQIQRENVLSKFRNGSTRILITTDLAGRGLDIPEVNHVIHYHFPITEEVYTHRNGRTARMDNDGNVYVIRFEEEDIPEYIPPIDLEYFPTMEKRDIPKPDFITISLNKGKRDKINKVDIVGFLSKVGKLKRDELGLVELKDSYALAAIHKKKINSVIKLTNKQKIKGKKVSVGLI